MYHRNFNLHRGPNLYLSDDALDRTVNMNYYTLKAGMSLDMNVVYREFSKTVNDDANAVAAITPGLYQYDDDDNPDTANLTNYARPVSVYADAPFAGKTKISSMIDPLLTLKVGWATSESDTACRFAVTSYAPKQTASKVDFYEVVGVGKGITKNFNAKIACNDQKTTVTDVAVSIPGLKLYDHANDFTLSAIVGGDAEGKAEITAWTFNATGSYMNVADALPYEIMKDTVLEFNGNVPDAANLLVKISYDTVEGNACSRQQ